MTPDHELATLSAGALSMTAAEKFRLVALLVENGHADFARTIVYLAMTQLDEESSERKTG